MVKFRLTTLLGIIGFLCFLCSLFLPAIRLGNEHGKVFSGFHCAGVCLQASFSRSLDRELVLMCQMSLWAMVLAPTIFFCRSIHKKFIPIGSLIAFLVLVAMIVFVFSVPYDGIGKTYIGFYIWLVGLLLIGFAGVADVLLSWFADSPSLK